MKVLLHSAFPLLDRHPYRKEFLQHLAKLSGKVEDATLVYTHTRMQDYAQEALKQIRNLPLRQLAGSKKNGLPPRRQASSDTGSSSGPSGTLSDLAGQLDVSVQHFHRLQDSRCRSFISDFKPDVIFALSGLYIPKSILAIPAIGMIGAHYGLLPDIRGGDTVRWSILLDRPLFVTHMTLSAKMDMGDILLQTSVPSKEGDTIGDLRKKCRYLNGQGHIKVLDALLDGSLAPLPQKEEEGTTFYRMGKRLREKVDFLLKENKYSHYWRNNHEPVD